MEKVTASVCRSTGRTHPALCAAVAEHLERWLGLAQTSVEFANGEIRPVSPRASTAPRTCSSCKSHFACGVAAASISSIMEQLIADRCRPSRVGRSGSRPSAVLQLRPPDHRKRPRSRAITARLVADLFRAAGAKRMLSIDLHGRQIQGFLRRPRGSPHGCRCSSDTSANACGQGHVVILR
jgi:ribose-phosphate pyrophosphokinase